ncbi:MAG: two-component regulator propeller domain-containing protein [Bacteroidota bacterium]
MERHTLLAAIFTISCLITSCTPNPQADASKESITMDSIPSTILQQDGFYLTNSKGDTVPTGVPFPAIGKKTLERIPPPKVIAFEEEKIPAFPNMVRAGEPKTVTVPEDLLVYIPGRDSVITVDTIDIEVETSPFSEPKPVPALPPGLNEEAKYDIQYLDIEQGLLSSRIHPIFQDSKGYLWFGCREGLSRYDGRQFWHYQFRTAVNLYGVQTIMEDKFGNIWFASQDQGVFRYDGTNLTHFSKTYGVVLEDQRGHIWFSTRGGICRYDGSNFIRYSINLAPKGITAMMADSKGNIWVGLGNYWGNGGVLRFDGKQFAYFSTTSGFGNSGVLRILEDSDGNIWFCTHKRISRFDGKRISIYSAQEGLIGSWHNDIMEDQEGNICISSNRGLNRFDGTYFTHFTTKEGLSDNSVLYTFQDKEGHYWVSTDKGVNRLDLASPIYFNLEPDQGIKDNFIEDSRGDLWFSSWNAIFRFSEGVFTRFSSEHLKSRNYSSVFEDTKGNVWFLSAITKDGILKFDGQKFNHFSIQQGFPGVRWYHFKLEDSYGKFWFISEDKGALSYFDPYNLAAGITSFTTDHGLLSNKAWVVSMDAIGDLWIIYRKYYTPSDFENGPSVTRYTFPGDSMAYEPGFFTHFSSNEGLSGDSISILLKDRDGVLWFGTENGIDYFDGQPLPSGQPKFLSANFPKSVLTHDLSQLFEDSKKNKWPITIKEGLFRPDGSKYIHYNTQNGLDDNRIWNIKEDKQKRVWVTTFGGRDLIHLFVPTNNPDNSSDEGYKLFSLGAKDGFRGSPKGIYEDKSGRTWLMGDGMLLLDSTNTFKPSSKPPQVQLTQIGLEQTYVDFQKLADKAYRDQFSFGKDLHNSFDSIVPFSNYPIDLNLPHHLNQLDFYVSAIDWQSPQKIQYSYWLEGYDKTWRKPQSESKVSYYNLPHGQYTFKVKAIGESQEWSEPFEYSFRIRPPWWQTTWAYLSLFALLVLSVYFIFQWRTYSLRKQRKLLRLQVAEQTQEIRLAKNIAEEANQAKSNFLSTVSHELRTPLTSIIGFAKINKKRLEERLPLFLPNDPKPQKILKQVNQNNEVIISEGERLTSLINGLLDMAKIESGKVEWRMEEIDPAKLIEKATTATAALFEQKPSLQIVNDNQKDLPTIIADRDRLIQVLINLISNAVKFTDTGHVKIAAKTRQGKENSEIIFSIQDTGSGIPPDHLDQIFERFKQVADNQQGKPKGTGLGLPICKEIVAHHGGNIWVESELGKGSTFAFTIPVSKE